jgi:polyribonucleotide nucleotidyltransferase
MDIKIAGITEEIMKVALAQAKDGRAHILARWPRPVWANRARGLQRPRAAHRDDDQIPRTRSAK